MATYTPAQIIQRIESGYWRFELFELFEYDAREEVEAAVYTVADTRETVRLSTTVDLAGNFPVLVH